MSFPTGISMTWTETFSCNVCGKRKGEVDHWWLAWVDQIQPSDEEEFKPKLQIIPWSERWMSSVGQIKRAASSAAD